MIVNGKEMNFEVSITVADLLNNLNLDADKVVVEVDREIISVGDYPTYKIDTHSKVELIRFVGGG